MAMLSIETNQMQSASVIKVNGRVDSDTAAELDDALTKLLQDNNKIVLNLEGVEYLSSAGLRSIVKAYQNAKKSGGNVHLASASASVEGILLTVGMLQMFKLYSTSEEAAAGF